MVLHALYKNGSHPTYHLVHNVFKLNVENLLYVNVIVVYRRGLSLALCYLLSVFSVLNPNHYSQCLTLIAMVSALVPI